MNETNQPSDVVAPPHSKSTRNPLFQVDCAVLASMGLAGWLCVIVMPSAVKPVEDVPNGDYPRQFRCGCEIPTAAKPPSEDKVRAWIDAVLELFGQQTKQATVARAPQDPAPKQWDAPGRENNWH